MVHCFVDLALAHNGQQEAAPTICLAAELKRDSLEPVVCSRGHGSREKMAEGVDSW